MTNNQTTCEGVPVVAQEPTTREHRLAEMFVALADTLVTGFDVVGLFDDLTSACVELLDVTAAGLMLADPTGRLRVMASSSERSRLLELLEIQNNEGPCLDCYRDGQPVVVGDLTAADERWPTFSAAAAGVGFGSVYALPMRLREETIGALNLFHRQPAALTGRGIRLGQALADVATIGILQQRIVQRGNDLADQLQTALNSRLIIEQAKGVLAEREQVDMSAAFELVRRYARQTGGKLSKVAAAVVSGELTSTDIKSAGAGQRRPAEDI